MLTLYRMPLGDPLTFNEQVGDPITNQGGAPVPALRASLRHAFGFSTLQSTVAKETVAERLKTRRQFRSLMNNTPFKLLGLYVKWDQDPEQSGWYMPDQGQLVDFSGDQTGLATGLFKIENAVMILAGKQRTHRRAQWVYLKDTRSALWPRDYRRLLYSTDFGALSALSLSYFPPGITDLLTTGLAVSTEAATLPAGADGSQCAVTRGLSDLARLSYEQPEASVNLGQVVVYDRRGEQTAPTGGPGAAWEEFYGPDYAYSWIGEGAGEIDAPVLDNGRCRVRWDKAHAGGWAIDVWTGTKWEEQGKALIERRSAELHNDTELLSASLVEYNESRAVIQAVMKTTVDPASREEVFITLQRGWSGPRIEVYPANNAAGEKVDAGIEYSLALADSDDSVMKLDSAGGTPRYGATAMGTGHNGKWAGANLGGGGFSGENEIVIGRWKASSGEALPFGVVMAVTQAVANAFTNNTTLAYGASRNSLVIYSGPGAHAGYMAVQFGFPAQQGQQQLEAESMTLSAGTSSTVDAAASNGKAATATRTADAAHVTQATWPNSDQATYRVFARVKTSVKTSKLKIYAKTPSTTGGTKETASEAYEWVDLGDIVATAGTLEIHAWLSAAGTLSVDRIEAFLIEDRNTAAGGAYEGGRDRGQALLVDSRTYATIVTRSV